MIGEAVDLELATYHRYSREIALVAAGTGLVILTVKREGARRQTPSGSQQIGAERVVSAERAVHVLDGTGQADVIGSNGELSGSASSDSWRGGNWVGA